MNNPRVVSQTLLRVGIKCAMHEFDPKTNTHYFLMREEELRGLTREAQCSLLEFHGLTPQTVTKLVADFYGVSMDEIMSKRRTERIVWPRQIAMTIMRRCAEISLNDVGKFFGGKDHGTVLHAERRVGARESTEDSVRSQIARLMGIINGRVTEDSSEVIHIKEPIIDNNFAAIKNNFQTARAC